MENVVEGKHAQTKHSKISAKFMQTSALDKSKRYFLKLSPFVFFTFNLIIIILANINNF